MGQVKGHGNNPGYTGMVILHATRRSGAMI